MSLQTLFLPSIETLQVFYQHFTDACGRVWDSGFWKGVGTTIPTPVGVLTGDWDPEGGGHLFYCRAFEQKNKNLTWDFYFFAQMLLNYFCTWDKYFFSHMRKNIFISCEKKDIYLICCKICHCKTLNHMAQAYSTLVVLVMSFLNFCSTYFWETEISYTLKDKTHSAF